jgi:hypothetical protein
LPDFKLYDKATKTIGVQVPIALGNRPTDNTYFIGIIGTIESPTERLLCYHISGGNYIVISYNFSSAKLLQNIVDFDLYDLEVAEYEGNEIKYPNPVSVPRIDILS